MTISGAVKIVSVHFLIVFLVPSAVRMSLGQELLQFPTNNGRYIIDVSDFGVVGDGETDNSSALIALRDMLISSGRDKPWEMYFPDGHYLYSNNRWIYGLTDVRVFGESRDGVRLQNVSMLRHVNDYSPFPRQGMFSLNGDITTSAPKYGEVAELFITGSRVKSLAPGAEFVELVNPLEAKSFEVGSRVLIHGFAMMRYGYSPNLRDFEWHKVIRIVDNKLFLEQPVSRAYDARWPEYPYSRKSPEYMQAPQLLRRGNYVAKQPFLGKPRILLLDGRKQVSGLYFYPENVEIRNLTLVENPNFKVNALAISARRVVLSNLNVGVHGIFNVYARETESTIIENCDISNIVEFDKIGNSVVLRDSFIRRMQKTQPHAIKAGTSINEILITNNHINGRVNVVALRRLEVTGNTIDVRSHKNRTPAISFYNGSYGGDWAMVSENLIQKRADQVAFSTASLYQNYSINSSLDEQGRIIIRSEDSNNGEYPIVPWIIKSMRRGIKIWLRREKEYFGVLDDVYQEANGTIKLHWLSGNLSGQVRQNDTLIWKTMKEATFNGVSLY